MAGLGRSGIKPEDYKALPLVLIVFFRVLPQTLGAEFFIFSGIKF